MGKLTISMAIFNSYVSHYQRVISCKSPILNPPIQRGPWDDPKGPNSVVLVGVCGLWRNRHADAAWWNTGLVEHSRGTAGNHRKTIGKP